MTNRSLLLSASLSLGLSACAAADTSGAEELEIRATGEALRLDHHGPTEFTPFAFTSVISTSGAFADGDVRLDAVSFGERTVRRRWLEPVARARIVIDDADGPGPA